MAASCGGGGHGGADGGQPPAVPRDVKVLPDDAKVSVSWDDVADATSYDVYSADSADVTTSSRKATTTSTALTVSGTNGRPVYVAVAARNAGGQSALSSVACGVPTPGGAPAAGFTLYDALCGSTVDGSLYTSAEIGRRIRDAALELEVTGSNLESVTRRGLRPASSVSLAGTGTTRITTWHATIDVPSAATAARAGSAAIQAAIVLVYQPVSARLAFPANQGKLIVAHVGLQDTGNGLEFFRIVSACTDPSCATSDAETGIVYDNGTFPVGQAASYGTPYTFAIAVDESAQTVTFSVSGTGIGGTEEVTANVSALFAAQGVDPARDFSNAQLRVRAFDPGAAGGSSGTMLARFDDVFMGEAGGAPVQYDDFSAPGIDPKKWSTGDGSVRMNGGALEEQLAVTATTTQMASSAVSLSPSSLPAATSSFRADVTISASTVAAAAGSENRFVLTRALYNDGLPGGTPPNVNQPNSAVGDVQAQVTLTPSEARFVLFHSSSAAVPSGPPLTKNAFNPLPISAANPLGVGTTHTISIRWNPTAHTVAFQLDDAAPIVVDPTSASDPYMASPAAIVDAHPHVASTILAGVAALGPEGAGSTESATFRLNNLIVSP